MGRLAVSGRIVSRENYQRISNTLVHPFTARKAKNLLMPVN